MAERQKWWLERRVVFTVGVFLVLGASIGWILHEPAQCVDQWPRTVASQDYSGKTCYDLLREIVDLALVALNQPNADRVAIEDTIKAAFACAAADNLLAPHDPHRDRVDDAYASAANGNWLQCAQELKGVNHPH